MNHPRLRFYLDTLARWIPDRSASVLVVGGGSNDRAVFLEGGYRDVTISNLDERMDPKGFDPYPWSFQDAEHLGFADRSFDHVVTHASLHHCHSPHRALIEMARVARRSAIAFESRDSLLMRLAERWGLTETFELGAVRGSDGTHGGVANTEIPNRVYRWTEREIAKTIEAWDPAWIHPLSFRYGFAAPPPRGNPARRLVLHLAALAARGCSLVAPSQGNLFAFRIEHPHDTSALRPWLRLQDGKPRWAG